MRGLAFVRLVCMIYFIFQTLIVIAVTTDTFWQFLTNLTHILLMFTYFALVVMHCQAGDICCTGAKRKENGTKRETCCQLKCWKLITFMYELSVGTLLFVFVAFWFMELPAVFNTPRHY